MFDYPALKKFHLFVQFVRGGDSIHHNRNFPECAYLLMGRMCEILNVAFLINGYLKLDAWLQHVKLVDMEVIIVL